MAQFNFLKNAQTSELLDQLKAAISDKINAGVVSIADVQKLINVINNPIKLKIALKHL